MKFEILHIRLGNYDKIYYTFCWLTFRFTLIFKSLLPFLLIESSFFLRTHAAQSLEWGDLFETWTQQILSTLNSSTCSMALSDGKEWIYYYKTKNRERETSLYGLKRFDWGAAAQSLLHQWCHRRWIWYEIECHEWHYLFSKHYGPVMNSKLNHCI